jgi:uncharacterized repeat protein (TIGR01451 family)
MTQPDQHDCGRVPKRSKKALTRGLATLLLSVLLPQVSAAQVILENTVKKVESNETASGFVEQRLVEVASVLPGDELRYTITFSNRGTQTAAAGSIVITNPLPEGTQYIEGTAAGADTDIVFSLDGENFEPAAALMLESQTPPVPATASDYRAIRWTYGPELAGGESGAVSFDLRLQ